MPRVRVRDLLAARGRREGPAGTPRAGGAAPGGVPGPTPPQEGQGAAGGGGGGGGGGGEPPPEPPRPKKPRPPSRKARLILRNLSFQCSEDELRDLFSPFGPVLELNMPRKPGETPGL
ncbi:RNA-binding protein 28-like, partial [Corapipo altera]|uniref:RNA-binding protein 28-like n=1 Tax=Corapipo altera TaxID=415028 RepID=UPI000FD62774